MAGTELFDVSAFAGHKRTQALSHLDRNESLSEGIGGGYGILRYRGKSWSLTYRGQDYRFTRADDGTDLPYLDTVILRKSKIMSKSYYPGQYAEGAKERPVCASLDGIHPDADVAQKQSNACAVCPKNVFKRLPNGQNAKDCSDYMRLAVLILPAYTKQWFPPNGLVEPVFLRVPPGSLSALSTYGDTMLGQGWHFAEVVTRIQFDPEKATPKFMFRGMKPLNDGEAGVIAPLIDNVVSQRITGEITGGMQVVEPAGMSGIALAPPAQAPAAPAPIVIEHTPAPAPAEAAVPGFADTGLVAGNGNGHAAPAAPIGQTVADVGELAVGGNPELDAKIAALLED